MFYTGYSALIVKWTEPHFPTLPMARPAWLNEIMFSWSAEWQRCSVTATRGACLLQGSLIHRVELPPRMHKQLCCGHAVARGGGQHQCHQVLDGGKVRPACLHKAGSALGALPRLQQPRTYVAVSVSPLNTAGGSVPGYQHVQQRLKNSECQERFKNQSTHLRITSVHWKMIE